MNGSPHHWINGQIRNGRCVYLILDSDGQEDALQALLSPHDVPQYASLYAGTPVSELAKAGPFLIRINTITPALSALLDVPSHNWGWLAATPGDAFGDLAMHWRARILVGERPQQWLYRFHDNRVLGRALERLPPEELPEYLGPTASLLYWHETHWAELNNPAPGTYPVPDDPAWLHNAPPPGVATGILRDNLKLYLLAEHSDALARLAQERDPNQWLDQYLEVARQWHWRAPEQLHLLAIQALTIPGHAEPPAKWAPHTGEAPQDHFERIQAYVKLQAGKDDA